MAKTSNKIHRGFGSVLADILIYGLLGLLALIMIYPFYNLILTSISSYEELVRPGLRLWPQKVDWTNYQIIFSDGQLLRSFRNTIIVTLCGTALSMIVTTSAGYAFSKKWVPGRNGLLTLFIITMYFGGGLVPWYLVMCDLGFKDNFLVMFVPGALSTWNMILMKNYFNTIPESLEESARIDGANDLRIMIQIVLPVAAPILATISLFYAVGFWNEWYNAMIFISTKSLEPLQLLLRRLVIESTMDLGSEMANQFRNQNKQIHSRGMQMASVTVATVPILLVYPFVQKHFAKGIMMGAVKG